MSKRARHRGSPRTSARIPRQTLADLLREIRREAGVSIKDAGPDLGVSYTYLSKIENGVVTPSGELLRRMANYFKRDSDDLYRAAGRIPPDVVQILQEHGEEAFAALREQFGRGDR